jgi:transmembrane protein TMEM260 (protein O-mannosyltransferase)
MKPLAATAAPTAARVHMNPALAGDQNPAWAILVPALLTFALYAFTCSPYVLNQDVAEFQALAAGHGIAHAGYPAYLLLLEAFHRLPLLTAPWRANLTSALAAAIAVAFFAATAYRYTGSRIAAGATACALALSYSLWHDGTRADSYAFTLALSAGAFHSFLRYRESRSVDPLAICGVLTGLSLTGHLSALALAGVIALTFLTDLAVGRAPFHHGLVLLVAVAVGLVPLMLIPLRDVPDNPMNYIAYTFDQHAARHIAWSPALGTRIKRAALLLSGAQYLQGGWFHPFQDALARVRHVGLNLALNDLPGLGLLLALAGLVAAFVRRTTEDFMLLAWLMGLTALFLYAAFPLTAVSFFLPGLWIIALFMARGLALVRARAWPVALVLAVALIATPWVRLRLDTAPGPLAKTSAANVWAAWPAEWNPFVPDRSWEEFGRGALAALPARAHVFGCWNEITTLLAVHSALHVRSDVTVHMVCDDPGRVRDVIAEARRGGAKTFTVVPPKRLGAERSWVRAGSWPRGGLWRYVAPAKR